jgi:hypothetical protein
MQRHVRDRRRRLDRRIGLELGRRKGTHETQENTRHRLARTVRQLTPAVRARVESGVRKYCEGVASGSGESVPSSALMRQMKPRVSATQTQSLPTSAATTATGTPLVVRHSTGPLFEDTPPSPSKIEPCKPTSPGAPCAGPTLPSLERHREIRCASAAFNPAAKSGSNMNAPRGKMVLTTPALFRSRGRTSPSGRG